MSEKDSNKGLWGRLTGANSSQESLHRGKSLDTKFADPSFLSGDEPGFPHSTSQNTGTSLQGLWAPNGAFRLILHPPLVVYLLFGEGKHICTPCCVDSP